MLLGRMKIFVLIFFTLGLIDHQSLAEEIKVVGLRVNPDVLDTDGDGISDSQEVIDHTSPTDAGSFHQVLDATLCSDWNGFLGMTNIVEHVNISSANIKATSRLYDIAGLKKSSVNLGINSGGQYDLIVNSRSGFSSVSYGKICATITKGSAGDLDGRMVYYKPGATEGSFQFAFAMPFGNGLEGSQFVHFDTTQPSLNPSDANNLVTNWVQITNLVDSSQSGKVNVYSNTGSKLGTISVNIPASGRVDIDAHRYGKNKYGLVEFVPAIPTSRFQVRNVRYYYDNPSALPSFSAAYPWEGFKGTGVKTILPLDTRSSDATIFVSNTTGAKVTAELVIYSHRGEIIKSLSSKLSAHATWSVSASSYLRSTEGIARISSPSTAGSLIASVTQVLHTSEGGIQTLYAVHASQPLGSVLRGSYNTFLSQGCRLLMANSTSDPVTVSLSMKRYDGTALLKGKLLTVAGNGLSDYNLCGNEKTPAYGIVTIQPPVVDSISAIVLRQGVSDGVGDSYRFPTPVRE